jgi:hypothetical protein
MKNRSNKKKTTKKAELKPSSRAPRVDVDKKFAANISLPGVSPEFWAALRERLDEKVICGQKYTLNVYNRVLVRDCANRTMAETLDMFLGLIRKGKRSAAFICSTADGNCHDALLVDFEITRDVCENRLWEIDGKWTFRCLVLV